MGRGPKIVQDWYQVERLGGGVSLIRERHVAPWLRCNMWHLAGRERDLLIDSGLGLRPLKETVAALTGRPVTLISTHCHFDHIGGAHEFHERLGHRAEAPVHAEPTGDNTGGAGTFVRAEAFEALPYGGFEATDFTLRAAPLTGYLDEGDILDLGDRAFAVLHLPGHSPGSIALYEASSRTLFSGDVVYDGALFDTVYHSDRALYRESLARLKELAVETVHAGHYASFGPARLGEIVDRYLAGGGSMEDPQSWVEKTVKAAQRERR